ncbi:MAG: energy transducer TonB [Bacteroidales bacterium]|jgi:protein TonB|nr:energy transducer TonB [Bacteroidales bacterium]MDD3665785.1 energy transducer TonB [Bacteroidales bacterium]
MVEKKSPKADLESKKVFFVQIGLILALGLVFLGFEWKTYEKKVLDAFERQVTDVPEEIVMITQQKIEVAATPPPPTTTIINIVEDDVEIEDEITIDAEANATTEIQEYVPVKHEEEEIVEAEIFQIVEAMPDFPGGDAARMKFLRDNIKYPQIARESGIQGTVYVTFVVEKDGRVTDIRVLRGIGGGCDEEAVRVIKAMPRWQPGKQRGKPVRVQFNMPIKFTLQG